MEKNAPGTESWVGLGNGVKEWVSAGSAVGCTAIPPGPVSLAVVSERNTTDEVALVETVDNCEAESVVEYSVVDGNVILDADAELKAVKTDDSFDTIAGAVELTDVGAEVIPVSDVLDMIGGVAD